MTWFILFQLRQNSSGAKVNATNYGQRVQRQVCSTINSSMEVASLHDLEVAGCYLVIPCTWTAGIEMKFLLRVFADTEISCGYETACCSRQIDNAKTHYTSFPEANP